MRPCEGNVSEKRLFGSRGGADKLTGPIRDLGHHVFHAEARCNGTATPIRAAFHLAIVRDIRRGLLLHPTAIDKYIGRHIERRRNTKILIETMLQRAGIQRLAVVRLLRSAKP